LIEARNRRELGNPPGKKNDPLGDQVSWEQLLTEVGGVDQVWIISNDADYILNFDGKSYLNPKLGSELISKNPHIKIHCFQSLAEGLRSFNDLKKIPSLPSKEELTEISEEEGKLNEIQRITTSAIPSGGGTSGYSGYTSSSGASSYPGYSGYGRSYGYSASGRLEITEPILPMDDQEESLENAIKALEEQRGKEGG